MKTACLSAYRLINVDIYEKNVDCAYEQVV